MFKSYSQSYFLLFFIISTISLSACQEQKKETEKSKKKILIVCTTSIIADGIKNIVDSSFEIIALMGPGIDPHIYKATPKDLQKLKKADVIFHNGLHLEGKMAQIFQKIQTQANNDSSYKQSTFAISDGIDQKTLRRLSKNTFDPHIWFDVNMWAKGIAYAGNCLIKLYPDKDTILNKYLTNYLENLTSLDTLIREQINLIPPSKRLLITSHDAFYYFGNAYGIEVKGLQGISTLDDFGLKDITTVVNLVIKRKIRSIFTETSVSSKSIEAVITGCEDRGYEVVSGGKLFSDALGTKYTPADNYIGMVKSNVNTIVEALK